MRVSHFIVPPAAYPRYRYTRQHVSPLFNHFRELAEKCQIKDPFTIPSYGEVHLYVITEDGADILSVADVASCNKDDVKTIYHHCADVQEFRNKCPDGLTTVHVASYKRAQENGRFFEYFGKFVVLIIDDEQDVMNEEFIGVDQQIIYVKRRDDFAKEIGKLLERIVFRELFKRVKILQLFEKLEQSQEMFACLQLQTTEIIAKQLNNTRLDNNTEMNAVHLHNKWWTARLEAVRKKVYSVYGKVPEVSKQFLDMKQDNQQRKVKPSRIYEDIIPFYQNGEMALAARQIPDELLSEITMIQKSQEVSNKATVIEGRFKNHLDCVDEHRREIENLLGICMGMYFRSKVPENERPTSMNTEAPTLKEHVAKAILDIKGVTGCGYRFRTLDIYIKDSLSDDASMAVSAKVREICENYGIEKYDVRTEQEKLTQFTEYTVGSKLTSRAERSASLGGFAEKGQKQDLCIVLSRHLADDGKLLYGRDAGKLLYRRDASEPKSVIAHVLKPEQNTERYGSLDIAVAKVLKKFQPNCLKMFKDSDDHQLRSSVINFDENMIEWLKGLPVHIWGASSSPGLGTIIIPDFYVEDMKRLVKVEDRHQMTEPFSKKGDSGAVVCADDPDGEVIYVVSMVMGSTNFEEKERNPNIKGEYLSFRLIDGILQLEQEHEDTFRLC